MADQFQAGDLLACWGADALSRVVSLGTSSPFGPRGLRFAPSHVAVVFDHAHDLLGRVLLESTRLCDRPCLLSGERVEGVQCQRISERIRDYTDAGGRVALYRLAPIVRPVLRSELLASVAGDLVRDRPGYDLGGALLSGTRLLKFSRLWLPNETLFCSELVARVLQICGVMSWSNPSTWNPGSLLRHLVRTTGVYRFEGRFDARHPAPRGLGLYRPPEEAAA